MNKKCQTVIIYKQGVVQCFDKNGCQISECQGFILDIADKLKECCDKNTEWFVADWEKWKNPLNLNWWFERWNKKKGDNEK